MIGVIGGSGLYDLEDLKVVEEVSPETPFGSASSPVIVGEIHGKRVAFLARHGRDHSYPPHLIPYRANLWALRKAGVTRVLAISAVGSINKLFRAGDFVVIDNFLDFTKKREDTYYEGKLSKEVEGEDKVADLINSKKVVHIDVTDPYCIQMRLQLIEILEDMSLRHHPAGVYACTEGPRFESAAEIKMLEKVGSDVVGMTGYPEVVLARELTMCYASLCVVANPAAGISQGRLTSDEVLDLMAEREKDIKRVVSEFIRRLPEEKTCDCDRVLDGAEV